METVSYTFDKGTTVSIKKYLDDDMKKQYVYDHYNEVGKATDDEIVVTMNANKNVTIFLKERTQTSEESTQNDASDKAVVNDSETENANNNETADVTDNTKKNVSEEKETEETNAE